MHNMTAEDILATISRNSKKIDLGSEINAEVYYNYNTSGSCSYSDSTVQHSNETVSAPEALFSSQALGPLVKEDRKNTEQPKSGEPRKNIPRKVSSQDYYVQINISVNEIRRGKRTTRMNAYLSLKDDNDKKFSIYLRCSLTSSLDETLRNIKKTDNKTLEEQFTQLKAICPSNAKLLVGRLRYNPRRFKIEDEHKTNLSSALLAVYDYGTHMDAIFYLLHEHYPIQLTDDLTEKQNDIFDFTGSFARDIEEEKND